MRNATEGLEYEKCGNIRGYDIMKFWYVDDKAFFSNSSENLENMILAIKINSKPQKLSLNAKKTKIKQKKH